MASKNEINEIGVEVNVDKFDSYLVNNSIPKHDGLGETSRRNAHFMKPKYILASEAINFLGGVFIP